MNHFDQWNDALSKQLPIQSYEEENKAILKKHEIYFDDFEEED